MVPLMPWFGPVRMAGRRAPAACLLLATACVGHAVDNAGEEARVRRVYDGDTIEVEFRGETERVRYIGIDTPEMSDPRPAIEEMAREAAAANRALVDDRAVRLEFDVQERDRYGRLLAYVWVGDTLVNERLVRDGFARAGSYPPNVRRQDRLRRAERAAREDGRRLWDGRLGDQPLRLPDGAAAQSSPRPTPPGRAGSGNRWPADRRPADLPPGTTAVCDSVAGARRLPGDDGLTFLNLGHDYPDQALTVVIEARDRASFASPPEQAYRRQRICVTGVVSEYRGRPQIRVRSPEQIVIQDPVPHSGQDPPGREN